MKVIKLITAIRLSIDSILLNMKNRVIYVMARKQADKQIFYVCLTISIALFVAGFFCPPLGAIDGSVLTAGGILLGFATLAVAGQNLAYGKDITFKKGDIEISVEDDSEGSK